VKGKSESEASNHEDELAARHAELKALREAKEAETGTRQRELSAPIHEIKFLKAKSESEARSHEEKLAAPYAELKALRQRKKLELVIITKLKWLLHFFRQVGKMFAMQYTGDRAQMGGLNGDESDGFDQSALNISQGICSFFRWQAYGANLKISAKDVAKYIDKNMARLTTEWCRSHQACLSPRSLSSR
jgi:hypothetical protein